ncbi:MAG TPA: hypothetical protein VLA56_16190 [Pseudomonadales bacterium]|nr:hypothetical protein [Pseudomonadales bacterium]
MVNLARNMAALLLMVLAGTALAAGPVAKITQVEGDIAYSRDGENWKPVTRNKYLFPGYQVRAGADGSAKVLNQESGVTHELGEATTIRVLSDDLEVVSGSNFGEPEEAGGSFWQALTNKFSTTQRYTTVRRSVKNTNEPPRVDTARDLAVSPAFADIVWSNAGPEYAYRLTVGENTYEVPPSSTGEMVRYTLPELDPGTYDYSVEVLLDGEVVYAPRRPSELTWLDDAQEAEVLAGLEERRADPVRNDAFVIADYLESNELMVAAMDAYREYFQEFPDENEMRPFLIKAYHDLKLLDLKEKEAITYNTVIASEAQAEM